MEWLSVRCEIEMNVVVSTSVVRRFEGVFLLRVHCYFVEVRCWGHSVAGLFHLLHGSFCLEKVH